jgi:hypothetical protein
MVSRRTKMMKAHKGTPPESPILEEVSPKRQRNILQTMQETKEGEDLKNMPIEELMAHEKGILNLFEHAL